LAACEGEQEQKEQRAAHGGREERPWTRVGRTRGL
jgi:hypothetical protein